MKVQNLTFHLNFVYFTKKRKEYMDNFSDILNSSCKNFENVLPSKFLQCIRPCP